MRTDVKLLKRPRTLIVNLDDNHLPGSHWVGIFAKDDVIEIFDSFGEPPPPRLQQWASRNAKRWFYEPGLRVQDYLSVNCGYFALLFTIARPHFKDFFTTVRYIERQRIDG